MGARFVKIGVVYLMISVFLGVLMHHLYDPAFGNMTKYFPREHSLIPLHTHVALLGGFLSIFIGLIYAAFPRAGRSKLAVAHFWISNIALAIFFGRVIVAMVKTHQFGGFLEPVEGGINTLGGQGYLFSLILLVANVFINIHDGEENSNIATK